MSTRLFFIICLCLAFSSLKGQNEYVHIDSILVVGNKHTKSSVILRELDLHPGDSIPLDQLMRSIERNERYLLNTFLFTRVKINVPFWENGHLKLSVDLQERWYIYPIPIFELADRNFNVWVLEQKMSLRRINTGVRFYYDNFLGYNDNLKLVFQLGYTQKYELEYAFPAVNKGQTVGIIINGLYRMNREVSINTKENKLVFLRHNNEFQLHRLRCRLGIQLRPGLRFDHQFTAGFFSNRLSQYSSAVNPDFFLDGRLNQRYLSASYRFKVDFRDIKPYPMHGFYGEFLFEKNGLYVFNDINAFQLTGNIAQYFKYKKLSLELALRGKLSFLREKQPYANNQAVGYDENYIRGYELYVIDGLDYACLKIGPRWELFDKKMPVGRWMPLDAFKTLWLKAFFRLNMDAAYVNNQYYTTDNPLVNTLLIGGGPAVDVIVNYNAVFQIEFNLNRNFEKGVYLHYKFDF